MKKLILLLLLPLLAIGQGTANNGGAASPGSISGSGGASLANPTALVGLAAVNGVAATAIRSDGAPALDQSISPTMTGVWTYTPTARSSGVAPYFKINIPTDTGITAATEGIGYQHATGTRTWATTGTVALQRENFFPGPTYASASASQTFTDAFNMYLTPPVAGSNAIFTRGHTLGVVDATSAASSITGGLVVSAVVGTAATSTGIGNGNINTGGTLTVGGTSTLTGAVTQTAKTTTYNNVATTGWGHPAIYASGRSTAQTAAVASLATYTNGAADGSYVVYANVNVTAATTATITVTCTYTDENNTSRTTTFSFVQNGVPTPIQTITNVTGVGAYSSMPMMIRSKASTAITIATAGTFTSVTYNAEGSIQQIN
jgi:hypothetical protein